MRPTLLLLVLPACIPSEAGIDRTILTGTLTIPPAEVDDVRNNNTLDVAQALGPDDSTALTYRAVVVSGTVNAWEPEEEGEIYGDPDYYAFSPLKDGTFTFSLNFVTSAAGVAAASAELSSPGVDTGGADTGADTGVSDADTGSSETGGGSEPDTGSSETGGSEPDTGLSETGGSEPDTGTADTSAPDTGASDTGGDTDDTSDSGDTGDTGDTADSGDTAVAPPVDADEFVVELVDLATYDAETGAGVVFSATTDGSGGAWTMDAELTAGGDYVILVAGVRTDEAGTLEYSLVLGGSAPDDTTMLVGAYRGTDPLVGENPLGGTNATGWVYDMETYTWTGAWRMMWIREVIPAGVDEDPDDLFLPSPTVDEAVGSVNLRAAILSTLSAAPSAGALYTTANVEATTTDVETAVATPLVVDGVRPKVIGIQATETLPDETLAEINQADNTLIMDTLVAQDLGMLSGLGYVDIVSGTSTFDPAYGGWNLGNDSDAFAFTVPEEMYVSLSGGWPDTGADIDIGIWYADPDYGVIDIFDWYCLTEANPEICTSAIALVPGTTYYLIPLAYAGTDEQAYTIELEWLAP